MQRAIGDRRQAWFILGEQAFERTIPQPAQVDAVLFQTVVYRHHRQLRRIPLQFGQELRPPAVEQSQIELLDARQGGGERFMAHELNGESALAEALLQSPGTERLWREEEQAQRR